jgi:hypothetical protein
MDMEKQINMCLFMSMILIQDKFDIEINNDGVMKTIWKHKEEKKKLIIIVDNEQQCKAWVNNLQSNIPPCLVSFLKNK